MKKSSKKLLLFLGLANLGDSFLNYSAIDCILPDLSTDGVRSIIYLLKKKYLIENFVIDGKREVKITTMGSRLLKSLFPTFFGSDQSMWHCAVFISAKGNDQAFRYLRTVMLNDGAYQLTRGVYIKAGQYSDEILDICAKLYQSAISIFTINQFIFGIDSHMIAKKMGVTDYLSEISGLSREIGQLLEKNDDQKIRNISNKTLIVSIFERIYQIGSVSGGYLAYKKGQEHMISELSQSCQSLIKLL